MKPRVNSGRLCVTAPLRDRLNGGRRLLNSPFARAAEQSLIFNRKMEKPLPQASGATYQVHGLLPAHARATLFPS